MISQWSCLTCLGLCQQHPVVSKSAGGLVRKSRHARSKGRHSRKWNRVLGTKYIYTILNFYMFHFVLNTQNCVCHREYLSGPIPSPHTHLVPLICFDRARYFPTIISAQIYSSCLQCASFWVQKIPLKKNGFSVLAWRRMKDGLELMTYSVFH